MLQLNKNKKYIYMFLLIMNLGLVIVPLIMIFSHGFSSNRIIGFEFYSLIIELIIMIACFLRLFLTNSMFSIVFLLSIKIILYTISFILFGFGSAYQIIDWLISILSIFVFVTIFIVGKSNKS